MGQGDFVKITVFERSHFSPFLDFLYLLLTAETMQGQKIRRVGKLSGADWISGSAACYAPADQIQPGEMEQDLLA
jgi:hypothetical protein